MPFAAGGVQTAFAQNDDAISYYRQAKIDWRQAAGKKLTIALNKHPFTESLLPLLPDFKSLTGIGPPVLTDMWDRRGSMNRFFCSKGEWRK